MSNRDWTNVRLLAQEGMEALGLQTVQGLLTIEQRSETKVKPAIKSASFLLPCMLAVLVTAGSFGATTAHAATNMIRNPGFEEDLSGWTTTVSGTLTRDTTERFAGNASVKIGRPGAYSGSVGQNGLSFEPGKAYYFSAAVKRTEGTGTVGLYLTQTGNKWGPSTYPAMVTGTVVTAWTQLRGIQTFPTQPNNAGDGYVYDNARFYVQHADSNEPKNAAGRYSDFYVDDVVVEPVQPTTVVVTGSASVAIPLPGNAAKTYAYVKTVKNQLGTTEAVTAEQVVWSLAGTPGGVSIDRQTGLLTVNDSASAGSIAVNAVSDTNSSAAGQMAVTLAASTPDSVPKAPTASNVLVGGLVQPGRTLTASYDYEDTNGDREAGTTLSWYAGLAANGAFTLIPDSASRQYTVSGDDLGKYLKFAVTPRTAAAPTTGDTMYSEPMLVVPSAAPAAGNVRISGAASIGHTLTGLYEYAESDRDPEAGSTFRWLISDSKEGSYVPIAGSTAKKLSLAPDMEGKFVKFEVTPADAFDRGNAYSSAPSERIDAGPYWVYYVDPVRGDDENSGNLEHPFRTIQRARDKVRTLSGAMTSDITVFLRGGTYRQPYEFRDEVLYNRDKTVSETRTIKAGTLTFDERDSGHNGFTVHYKAFPGEKPVISGGRAITGWTLHDASKNIYKANGGGNLDTRQLYVNGVRAVRARSAGGLAQATNSATGHTTTDTFLAGWNNIKDIEMVYKEKWTSPRSKVDSITVKNGIANIVMQQPGWYFARNKGGTSATNPWYYENAYELLDEEGEWYYDRTTGDFYYKPRAGENLATAEVIAPELEELVNIQGSSLDDVVSHLTFSGISFQYATWLRPSTKNGLSDAQNNYIREWGVSADYLIRGAVNVQNAHFVTFEGNQFTRLGSIGLRTADGTQDSLIAGNTFTDISGSAIAVGDVSNDQKQTTDPRKLNRNNDVLNNYIHNIGVEYYSSAGISAGYAIDMDISHNEIGNIPYSGIHAGYGWSISPSSNLRNMRIQNNLIYDVMQKLNDGGNIYTLGTTGGSAGQPSLISGNYLVRDHDVGQGAIYFDEGSNYWNATDNVIETAPNFLHVWTPTAQNIAVDRTYTNTPKFVNNSATTTLTNTRLFEAADWPSAALSIIKNAGLEAAYKHLRPSEPIAKVFIRETSLASGQTAPLQIEAALGGSGAVVDPSGSSLSFTSNNPDVATIDGSGVVTAVGTGIATLTAQSNGSTIPVVQAIYVNDVYDGLTVSNERPALMVDQTSKLEVSSITKLGRQRQISALTFESAAPEVATVDVNGKVSAVSLGTAAIRITAVIEGTTESGTVSIQVVNEPASNIVKDTNYWYISDTGKKTVSNGALTMNTPSGFAAFQGKRYGDELLKMNMSINDTAGWHALSFRSAKGDQSYSEPTNDAYMIVFSPTGVELHRFNKGTRTVLYGTIAGFTPKFGGTLPNAYMSYGTTHLVEYGALNTANGVRIILEVDGHRVIDCVDSFEGRITAPGFAGLYARTGSITLSDYRPEPPIHLRAAAKSANSIELAWDASPSNTGTVQYTVYGGDGTVVGSTYGYSLSIAGLQPATGYTFYVKSTNAKGFVSDASPTIAVTTEAVALLPAGLAYPSVSANTLVSGKSVNGMGLALMKATDELGGSRDKVRKTGYHILRN
ncbi:Ig-like domain-containing protein [Paenibacillus hodogayensis]|uniref:Ig-like domain-containing protein n=1 Tax=Paenibacillus hodogayensis TaxID=279208 RepID=A0ABV5W390_9BACL